MLASEIISILKKQIEMVGDKPAMINGKNGITEINSAELGIIDDNRGYTDVIPNTYDFDCILLRTKKELW